MTVEEAIRRIKEHNRIHFRKEKGRCPFITEALNMAISALEKQIPQEPIKLKSNEDIEIGAGTWKAGTTVYKCPCCDSFISRSSNYCPHCGCRMDLEDEEQK